MAGTGLPWASGWREQKFKSTRMEGAMEGVPNMGAWEHAKQETQQYRTGTKLGPSWRAR